MAYLNMGDFMPVQMMRNPRRGRLGDFMPVQMMRGGVGDFMPVQMAGMGGCGCPGGMGALPPGSFVGRTATAPGASSSVATLRAKVAAKKSELADRQAKLNSKGGEAPPPPAPSLLTPGRIAVGAVLVGAAIYAARKMKEERMRQRMLAR